MDYKVGLHSIWFIFQTSTVVSITLAPTTDSTYLWTSSQVPVTRDRRLNDAGAAWGLSLDGMACPTHRAAKPSTKTSVDNKTRTEDESALLLIILENPIFLAPSRYKYNRQLYKNVFYRISGEIYGQHRSRYVQICFKNQRFKNGFGCQSFKQNGRDVAHYIGVLCRGNTIWRYEPCKLEKTELAGTLYSKLVLVGCIIKHKMCHVQVIKLLISAFLIINFGNVTPNQSTVQGHFILTQWLYLVLNWLRIERR